MNTIDQRIEELTQDKSDIEKDLYGSNSLQELNYRFSKQKKEIEFNIYRLSRECEKFHQKIKDLEQDQVRLRKQIVNKNFD